MIIKPEPLDKQKHVISSKSTMCKTDINGIIEYANEYFVELSGYGEGEIIGESLNLIHHPEMPKTIIDTIWDSLLNKKKVNGIIRFLSKNGSYYWLQIKFDFKVNEDTRSIANIYLYATSPDINTTFQVAKLYSKLNKIEKEVSLESAKNYFKGFLENANLSYDDFISNYLKA